MVYCIFSVALQAEEDLLLGREGKGALLESRTRVSHTLYQYCWSDTTFTLESLAMWPATDLKVTYLPNPVDLAMYLKAEFSVVFSYLQQTVLTSGNWYDHLL